MRERIYKRLGLPLGSLKEESGRDWNNALKEIEEEDKKALYSTSADVESEICLKQRERHQREADKINKEFRDGILQKRWNRKG